MVKTLQRLGNSSALVVDRAIMDLMGISQDTPLKLTVQGRKLVVEPMSSEDRKAHFKKQMETTGRKNAELFKRLAK